VSNIAVRRRAKQSAVLAVELRRTLVPHQRARTGSATCARPVAGAVPTSIAVMTSEGARIGRGAQRMPGPGFRSPARKPHSMFSSE